ncbi:hypothetical protein PENSPDRAFT_320954 [Peniophora sp. CONT]|nr:hypothetical protein PENSPDRAFT_320954 [Peniophora sp. CONT]
MQSPPVRARTYLARAEATGTSATRASTSSNSGSSVDSANDASPQSSTTTETEASSAASSASPSAPSSIFSTTSSATAQETGSSSSTDSAISSPLISAPSSSPLYPNDSPPSNSAVAPAASSGPTLSSSRGGVSSRTIIGASVGGGAFLLILAAILALSFRRRSRRQRVAPSSEFLHPVAQEQFRYARSAHTMSMDSGLLSSSMEKFPASPPLPSMSPHMESLLGQAAAASPSASRQSTLSTGSPQPAMYSHRARASSAGSVALSSLYVLADNGLRGGGSPLMQGFDFESPQQTYTRATHSPEVVSPFIVPEEPHDIGVAR